MAYLPLSFTRHASRITSTSNRFLIAVFLMNLTACSGGGGGGTVALEEVVALFGTNGSMWNDYVAGDVSTAIDAACNPASPPCFHGGEVRKVTATGKTSCAGLTAADDLGAFNWSCDASSGSAQFISTGLADGMYLSDLINFTAPGSFKTNAVTVFENGAAWGATPGSVWWLNPFEINNDGGSLSAIDSTIYLITNDTTANYTLTADKFSLVVQPGNTLTGPGSNVNVIDVSGANYGWIEGAIDASGDQIGVHFNTVLFSMLSHLDVSNGNNGVVLTNASYNTLSDVTSSSNQDGIDLGSSSNFNMLSGVTAINNNQSGIFLDTVTDNTFTDVISSNNGTNGVLLLNSINNSVTALTTANNVLGVVLSASSSNVFSSVTANNNTNIGVFLVGSTANTFLGVTANNNTNVGVTLDGSTANTFSGVIANNSAIYGVLLQNSSNNNTLQGITASNNGGSGVALQLAAHNNTLSGVTVTNNSVGGVFMDGSTANTLLGVAASNNDAGVVLQNGSDNNALLDVAAANNVSSGIALFNASNNQFSGLLRVGDNNVDCFETGGTNPGLVDGTCASGATLTAGITLANSFVGKVMNDDSQNSNNSSGVASFPLDAASFDWSQFDSPFRAWGIDGSPAFPNADQQGQWTTGDGRIWDWSLAKGDTGNSSSPALLGVITFSPGRNSNNDLVVHAWNGTPGSPNDAACSSEIVTGSEYSLLDGGFCFTDYLRAAVEIMGDGIGNDNTLCESNETCLYTPNIGSYQGHGNLVAEGSYSFGTVQNVTLMKYQTNGYAP